jgi:signal transduction histidine kinase/ActR/RegA family two-component response regulator
MNWPEGPEGRVLVYAPIGRDGAACARLLQRDGLDAHVCADIDSLVQQAHAGVLVICVTEEALFGKNLQAVRTWLATEPAWSDPPFVVLTSRVRQVAVAAWRETMVDALGNVSLLERPMESLALTTMVRTAARSRQRQYQIRALLRAREEAAAELEDIVIHRTRQLEAANAELQRQIAERERIENSLRQAQKLEALGQLTGGVAHDFNNLLMVVSGGLQILERPVDAERRQRTMQAMQRAVDRGAGLTRQLLSFARRQTLQPRALDLSQQVRSMLEMLQRSLRGDINVELQLADDLWVVEADPGELELVIINLALNARDAMPRGGTITIRTANIPGSPHGELQGDHVGLSIIDNGMGIPPGVQARILEPFFTTKDVGKGSGLGLPQAYGFATQSGGTLQIHSEVGRGTTVRLVLPRSAMALDEPQPIAPAAHAHPSPLHVLLVEDDNEVAALTTDMLVQLGYEVTCVGSAGAALDTLDAAGAIDAVLSDIMMPGGMSGVHLAQALRERRPGLPVVLTTGYPGEEARRAKESGIPLLPKPYLLDDLAAVLSALLAARAAAATPPAL